MKKVVLLIISLLSIIYMSASAMNLSPSRLELEVQSLRVSSDQYIASYLKSDKPEDEFGNDTTKDKTIYEYDYRSPKKAFLYS